MFEMAVRATDDAPILKRVAAVAAQMAMGGSLVLEPVGSIVVSSTITASPTAAIFVEAIPRPLLDRAPDEVKEFVATLRLSEYVSKAESLLKDKFPSGSVLSLQIEVDPEAEGKWLVIDVGARCEARDALRAYNDFVAEWVATTPPATRDALRITFNLS